jgi:DDE family transposase
MKPDQTLGFDGIHRFLHGLFGADMHAKRVLSLANATLGVVSTASLAVHTIGQGLALARGLVTKHAVKQVDRLLSNDGIDIDAILPHWVHHVAGSRIDIKVAMDWTDFDADKQTTIMLSLMTGLSRTTPLVWLTVDTATLKNHRNEYEYQVLVRLADMLPAGVKVCIVADRGFGDQKLYRVLTEELHFDYVIRFRGNIKVTAADGEQRTALGWVGPGGRATVLRGAMVTADQYQVGTVLCVRDKDMKGAWCLATSYKDATAGFLKGLYGKRWGIDIDQAWRLSRIKGWVGSICNEAFWVEHRGSVFNSVRIRAADRQAIADLRGRAAPTRRRGVRRARRRQDWRAGCRAIPDIGRGSP